MPQRQGKQQGVRTNATIRRNVLEHRANRGDFVMDKNILVPFSLSKSKRWKLLDDEEERLPIRQMIPMNVTSNINSNPSRNH